MISKFKELLGNNTPIVNALKELRFYVNDTNFSTQQQISQRLRVFFSNDEHKRSFLKQLLQIVQHQLEQEGNFYVKLKMLLLIHIIISSQIARAEFSKLLINIKLSINVKTTIDKEIKIGLISQQYYYYIYKLAAQTTLINEELNKPQDDLMIYFTLSNQCYIGMNIQQLIEQENIEHNILISNLVKFLYFDIQDIYIFILKDVKYLVEKSPHLIKNKLQLVELYKECQTLQDRMLQFYKFNMLFSHISMIMPPHSIQIKSQLITQITNSFNQQENNHKHQQSIPILNIVKEPRTAKNSDQKSFQFNVEPKRPMSPETNPQKQSYFPRKNTQQK